MNMMSLGARNLVMLFFATMAASLVVLIICFSLFFKNIDLSFNTKNPDAAPNVDKLYEEEQANPASSKADGVSRASVRVPQDTYGSAGSGTPTSTASTTTTGSTDAMGNPTPITDGVAPTPAVPTPAANSTHTNTTSSPVPGTTKATPINSTPAAPPKPVAVSVPKPVVPATPTAAPKATRIEPEMDN